MVRDKPGIVLYDQLEDIPQSFVNLMRDNLTLVPDLRISPNKANESLRVVLEMQKQVDERIR